MSHQQQAQYLVSLPLVQFRAIKKAITILARSGMCREMALSLIVEQHQATRLSTLKDIPERY